MHIFHQKRNRTGASPVKSHMQTLVHVNIRHYKHLIIWISSVNKIVQGHMGGQSKPDWLTCGHM
uniref:Uncharacterized protein n=1 Tax=Anguilla anguilla TaxID=7936 RepID=A0A0E9WR46_ANGAN